MWVRKKNLSFSLFCLPEEHWNEIVSNFNANKVEPFFFSCHYRFRLFVHSLHWNSLLFAFYVRLSCPRSGIWLLNSKHSRRYMHCASLKMIDFTTVFFLSVLFVWQVYRVYGLRMNTKSFASHSVFMQRAMQVWQRYIIDYEHNNQNQRSNQIRSFFSS